MRFSTRLQQSTVWMRLYSDAEIAAYVATGSPLDKAGAYGIQDQPFAPVERLEGCFASVMGLPLAELAQLLTEIGVPLPDIGPLCSHHTGIPCCQLPKGDQS
jgi:predicted house-cleaning NTP pyrophosphatase (Maf/HAM1 superfamily)